MQWRSVRLWAACAAALLLFAVLLGVVATIVEHRRLTTAQDDLRNHLRPAQTGSERLARAYDDQETGERGFLLTGEDEFLQPYLAGRAAEARETAALERLLAGNPQALRALAGVTAAGRAWQATIAEPTIATRRDGPMSRAQILQVESTGKGLFDTLRARLGALAERVGTLVSNRLAFVTHAQRGADIASAVALSLGVAASVASVVLLYWLPGRPINRLLRQVRSVAGGNYEQHIDTRGPQEIAVIAGAVERMRDNIMRSSQDLVVAQQQLSRRDERDRLAADLHDLIIQRVFALGLSLSSLASQNRELAPQLEKLIDDSDRIIRELRGVIFSLSRDDLPEDARSRVTDLVHEASGVLRFTPHLEFSGQLDRAAPERIDEMLAVAREALSNVARHARASSASVVVTATPTRLRLTVTDDGIGISDRDSSGNGTRNLYDRAHRWGGEASVTATGSAGTRLDWSIPID